MENFGINNVSKLYIFYKNQFMKECTKKDLAKIPQGQKEFFRDIEETRI